MSALRVVLATVALAVVPASSALAAAPWSPPVSVATGNPHLAEPTIAFGNNGRALLSARITTNAQGLPRRGFSRLFGQQADGSFAGRGRIVLGAPPAVYGRTRLGLLRLPLAKGNLTIDDLEDPESSLGYSFGRTGGRLEVDSGAYRRLSRRADRVVLPGSRNSAAIAANDRGDVAAVWVEHLSGRDHLVAALRRPNRPFGRPAVIVGSGFLSSPAVTWSAGGDLLVAPALDLAARRADRAARRGACPTRRPQLGAPAAVGRVERLQPDLGRGRAERPHARRVGHAGPRHRGQHAVDRARRPAPRRPARVPSGTAA
jgi:hypothetical protein